MADMLRYLFVDNWRTTAMGVGAFLMAAGHLLNALAIGDSSAVMHDMPIILAGLGLIVAKDGHR